MGQKKQTTRHEHYKNVDFAKNLVAASGTQTLEEAALQWRFGHFGKDENGRHCQLCHSRLNLWVMIRNSANGVVLFIGHDCYDKLVAFLATKKLQSLNLGSRKQYISTIKKYCREHITESFLKWFKEQDVPEEHRKALEFAEEFGYAPTLETAQALVQFYKTTRLFPLGELLDSASQETEILRRLFWDFPSGTNPLERGITLADFETLDLTAISLSAWLDSSDEFFRKAASKVAIPGPSLVDFLRYDTFRSWVGKVKREVPFVVDDEYKRAVVSLERLVAENQNGYRLLTFREGFNRNRRIPQWETWSQGKKYVLSWQSAYEGGDGAVLVEVVKDLVPNKVFLVSRLEMVPTMTGLRWETA